MAINWGVALGAAAESGFKTYERLGEEEYREMMREKVRRERDQEKQFESAMANARKVDYTGGEAVADTVAKGLNFTPEQQAEFNSGLNQLTPDKQAEVLRAYSKSENATGGVDLSKIGVYKGADGNYMASNESKPRNSADIYRDVANEMQASGNTTGLMKAIGIKTAVRESDLQDKFDDWSAGLRTRMSNLQTTINNNGLSGVPAIVNPELKKAGITTEFVDGTIVAKKGGKVVGQFSNGDDVLGAVMNLSLEGIASELLPMMGSPQAVASFLQGQQQIALKGREVEIKNREVGIKAGDAANSASYRDRMAKVSEGGNTAAFGVDSAGKPVFQNSRSPGFVYGDSSPVPSDMKITSNAAVVAGTRADTGSMSSKADDVAEALVGSGEINPATNKPFASAAEAKSYAYKLLLKSPDARAMTEAQKIAYPKFLEAVGNLRNPTPAELIGLARQFNLPGSITGLPEAPGTQTRISGVNPKDFEASVLNGGKKEPPKSAIPTGPSKPAYTPPADSPAGRSQARGEQIKSDNIQQQKDRVAASAQADARVIEMLPSMSQRDAYDLQNSKEFSLLSPKVKAAVQQKVFGR